MKMIFKERSTLCSYFKSFSLLFFYTLIFLAHINHLTASDTSNFAAADLEKAIEMVENQGEVFEGLVIDETKKLGIEGWPILKTRLSSQNVAVKNAVLTALSQTKVPCEEFSESMLPLLSDANWTIRHKALFYLCVAKCRLVKKAVCDLLDRESHWDVISTGLDYLGNVGDVSDINRLKQYQDNDDLPISVRLRASRSLVMLGGDYDPNLVKTALDSKDRAVVIGGLKALEKSADSAALPWLEPLLSRKDEIGHKAFVTKEWVYLNDSNISDQQKSNRLVSLLETSSDDVTRWAAYRLLERFPDQENVNRLKTFVQNRANEAAEPSQKARAAAVFEALEVKGLMTQQDLPKEKIK